MDRQLSWQYLGLEQYDTVRQMQRDAIRQRLAGLSGDSILVCQHPATITFGKNVEPSEGEFIEAYWQAVGAEYRKTDRGGQATFHSPGQFLIYPVFNLTDLGLGVRSFVVGAMDVISKCLSSLGIANKVSEDPVGIWVSKNGDWQRASKIAFAGIRVRQRVTDHGFALNFDNDLSPFSQFKSCGLDSPVTSVSQELGQKVSAEELLKLLEQGFREWHALCCDGRRFAATA